ncbi:putative metal-binding motif-containing protein [Thermodesulfobacteriota bacterium]
MHKRWVFVILTSFAAAFLLGAAQPGQPENLLERYEPGDESFRIIEVGGHVIYFKQRMVGEAIVEKDMALYRFDKASGKLLDRKAYRRADVPEHLPADMISRAQAETLAEGEAFFANLYIISSDSDVFPVDPTPKNPCWVVRSESYNRQIVTIIDAVEGRRLGLGVPPPYNAFSLTGPIFDNPCSQSWTAWYQDAADWFDAMGYSTERVEWPTEAQVRDHIQSEETVMFYELAHGDSYGFASGCSGGSSFEYTTPGEIGSWIAGYDKMPFSFIGSCSGMCSTGNNTLSYELRKGSSQGTTTVGYCGMAEPECDTCWSWSLTWQETLFSYMYQGYTVKEAFDEANANVPVCANNNCMRFAGDEDMIALNCFDEDDDGYRDCEGDCNDFNAAVYPCALEVPGNGIDEDCSGSDRTLEPGQAGEAEPNDEAGAAQDLGVVDGTTVLQGNLCTTGNNSAFYTGDLDYYRFRTPEAKSDLTFQAGLVWPGSGNFDLWLYTADGQTPIAYATSINNPETLTKLLDFDTEYVIMTAGWSGDPGDYRLTLDILACGDGDGDEYADVSCGGDDCDDGDAAIHPGAADPCDGVDQDCGGADGVPEIPGNGVDDDCDGKIDENCFIGTVL